jgi:hypothetical protein
MEEPDMSSISKTADDVAEYAKIATVQARSSLEELGSQAQRLVKNLRERETIGALLAHFGRRHEPRSLAPILWFVTGAAVAGGALFFLTPRGAALRARIRSLVNAGKGATSEEDRQAASDMTSEGGGSFPRGDEELVTAH